MKWIMQYQRLSKMMKGITVKYMRFYIMVAVPQMLYAADLFLILQSEKTGGTKEFINMLVRVQQYAGLHTTRTMQTVPTIP